MCLLFKPDSIYPLVVNAKPFFPPDPFVPDPEYIIMAPIPSAEKRKNRFTHIKRMPHPLHFISNVMNNTQINLNKLTPNP